MQIDEQLGTDWTQSTVSKGELKVEAFLSGFPLCIQKLRTFCFFLIVLGFPAVCWGAAALSSLLMSPVHQDSILFTVSNFNFN